VWRRLGNLAAAVSLVLFVGALSVHIWTLDRYELVQGSVFGTAIQLCPSGGALEIIWVGRGHGTVDLKWTRESRPLVRRSNFSGRRFFGAVSGFLRVDNAVIRYLVVPHAMLLLATAVLPCAVMVRRIGRRRNLPQGRCASCGYEGRCPECGVIQDAKPNPPHESLVRPPQQTRPPAQPGPTKKF
jgi:hypothetical protein